MTQLSVNVNKIALLRNSRKFNRGGIFLYCYNHFYSKGALVESFGAVIILLVIGILISTQAISSNNTNGDEIATNLEPNQVHIILDSHIYYHFEYSGKVDKNGNKVVSSQDHRSIETNIISSLNETRNFNFGKEKEEVKITVNQVDKEKFMLDFDITYYIDGQKINLTPSLLAINGKPASLVSNEDNYKFELNIKVIK